jgi:hypothetical protein
VPALARGGRGGPRGGPGGRRARRRPDRPRPATIGGLSEETHHRLGLLARRAVLAASRLIDSSSMSSPISPKERTSSYELGELLGRGQAGRWRGRGGDVRDREDGWCAHGARRAAQFLPSRCVENSARDRVDSMATGAHGRRRV